MQDKRVNIYKIKNNSNLDKLAVQWYNKSNICVTELNMDMQSLQEKLDIDKWLNSEKLRRDLCGEYDYCAYCENESEFPCAYALTRLQEKLQSAPLNPPQKAINEIAATVIEFNCATTGKRYVKTFAEKLAETKNEQKNNLIAIEQIFNSHGVKGKMTRKYVNFRFKRKLLAVVSLNRGCLRLQLALSPAEYDNKKFPHDDYAAKKCYSKVPYSMKIQSALSLKRARKLIEDVFETLDESK